MDAWTGELVGALDDGALRALAHLLDYADAGYFPSFWQEARTVGIPKDESTERRPLTIMSCFYRTWASRHARLCMSWLDSHLPSGAYGARPCRSAADCAWIVQVAFDEARAHGQPLHV